MHLHMHLSLQCLFAIKEEHVLIHSKFTNQNKHVPQGVCH